ncbi:MAG: tetratricopeptide repeat protein [Sediminibacterium sp.]|nr:tetratricopeptide repeat protein [Sediminibacterium sp.]
MFKKSFIWVILTLCCIQLTAQTDSLQLANKIEEARGLFTSDPDKALKISTTAQLSALRLGNRYLEAYALNTMGSAFFYLGNIDSSITYHLKALQIQQTDQLKIGMGRSYTNLGLCYIEKHQPEVAISYFIKAEPCFRETDYKIGLSKLYNSLGVLFYELNQYQKSEAYYIKGLKIAGELNDSTALYNISANLANVYDDLGNTIKAIKSYNKAYEIAKAQAQNTDMVFIANNLASIYCKTNRYDSAWKYNEMAYRLIQEKKLDYRYKKATYGNRADILCKEKRYAEALRWVDSSAIFAVEDGDYDMLYQIRCKKENIYYQSGNYVMAYQLSLKNRLLYDSLRQEKLKTKTDELETKYEAQKKDLLISQQESRLQLRESENKRKTLMLWSGLAVLVISLLLMLVVFRSFKRTQKANRIISKQNNELEIQKQEIENQKQLVEEKQKEIIDSINYAQRIQHAVLTGKTVWEKIGSDYFVLFKPKDIVSGDFYWAYNAPNGRSIFALADCTGHGVPGGFMSMLGNSFLNELVIESKLFKADVILNKLRDKVIHALEQQGKTNQKDGMDMALCVWNRLDNTLEFAGANNPIWIFRNGKIEEYKADKMPIGFLLDEQPPFKSQTILLEKGDVIYMSSDGFPDQFGGPKGKKYMYRKMEQFLVSMAGKPMAEQHQFLIKEFNDWKGNLEQLDDVCVLGVRV